MKKIISNKGFTLIELLVVVSIVGLLSSIVMASVVDARMKARDTTRVEQLHQMDLAIGLYKSDHEGKVPLLGEINGGDGTGCSAANQINRLNCVARSSGGDAWEAFRTAMAPYISTLPNSLNGIDYIYLPPASMGSGASDDDYQVSADSEYDPNIDLGYSSEGYIIPIPEPEPVAPTATVSYDKTTQTSGSVVATIVPSESVTVTNPGGSESHTFTSNGSFTFNFVNDEGTTGSTTATVSNILSWSPDLGPATWAIANQTCISYGGGNSGWHLPSREELGLGQNSALEEQFGNGINFDNNFQEQVSYWTSFPYNSTYYWVYRGSSTGRASTGLSSRASNNVTFKCVR
jgi:prepilin-type N-terminal cleavage/methylation domain-containing protein